MLTASERRSMSKDYRRENLPLDTRVKALEVDVNLNMREIMIAFKRLVNVELRVEELENKLRGLKP